MSFGTLIKENLKKTFTGILVLLVMLQTDSAAAADKTKILIGAGLIGAGASISVNAANDLICFSETGCGNEEEIQFFAGLAMIGVGAFLLIKGIRQDDKQEFESIVRKMNRQTFLIEAGPARKGAFAVGVRIRW